MSSPDITRRLFQPDKRYSGVVRLQGAVLLDSDDNEREAIDAYDERAVINDAIGANGTPNDGFKIAGVTPAAGNSFNLQIKAGSYFLGGQRFEAPADFTLTTQPDWIAAGETVALPDHTGQDTFFVWLEGHEQEVSAREDGELLEVALNGVETSARTRAMTRVRITPSPRDNCIDALADVVAAETANYGVYDPATGAVTGATRMNVAFNTDNASEDLCTPSAAAGYLGADNETIRVQVTYPGHFIWGVSNAAPVYRVQLSLGAAGKLTHVTMLTPPWDQVSQPHAGDVVEFLPWEAQLPNGEKVARESGIFARVASSFAPAGGTFDIEDNDAALLPVQTWLGAAAPAGQAFYSARDDVSHKPYVYMRVWRGTSFAAGNKQLTMSPGGVKLGQTGLTVTFDGPGRIGDYYEFSVRPHTPHVIMPWTFQDPAGALPTGPKRILAALAFIDWGQDGANGLAPLIEDCRRRFRPLSHASSCCEITVGDGVHSHGDFTSIQAAVDALPPEGGKVCVLKGEYSQVVDITNRKYITLEGCGDLTWLHLPDGAKRSLIAVRDSYEITIRDLALTALDDIAVTISKGQAGCQDITMEKLSVMGRDAPAIMAAPVDRFTLRDCEIGFETLLVRVTDVKDPVKPGALPGVIIGGTRLTVEDCRIHCENEDILLRPFGGIHILSGSQIVSILRNKLYRLGGMGVALGSYRFVAKITDQTEAMIGAAGDGRASYSQYFEPAKATSSWYYIEIFYWPTDDGCGEVVIILIPPPGNGVDWHVDVGDPIEDLDIIDNTITDTGLSGISVLRFFDLEKYPVMIAINRLEIRHNRIHQAARTQLPILGGSALLHSAFGGVTLAQVDGAMIADNDISGCGGNTRDPYCGVFILRGRALAFTGNRIVENGGAPLATDASRFGQRGGVVIGLVSAPVMDHPWLGGFLKKAGIKPHFPRGVGALRFNDNVVVQAEGRAVQVLADGPVMMCNNELVSRGSSELTRLLPYLFGVANGPGAKTVLSGVDDAITVDFLAFMEMLIGGAVVAVFSLPADLDPRLKDMDGDAGAQDQVKQYLADLLLYRGEVMIDDNRIVFDGINEVADTAVCGVSVYGADAVAFSDNQYQANLLPGDTLALAHILLVTDDSIRANNNTVRHPVTQVKSTAAAPSDGTPPHVSVNEYSIGAMAPVITVMLNQVSGEIYTNGLRILRDYNAQLFPNLSI